MKTPTFKGYRRENGRVGIRNHVIILPVDDISNAACEAVANNIKGTLALPHAYGRLQFGEDLELFFRTMIGTGANPNVAAVVVIGIEPGWTQRIVDGIAKTGKPVAGFSIERHGDIQTIASARARRRNMCNGRANWSAKRASSTSCIFRSSAANLTRPPGFHPARRSAMSSTNPATMGGTASFGETSELTGGEHIVKPRRPMPKSPSNSWPCSRITPT